MEAVKQLSETQVLEVPALEWVVVNRTHSGELSAEIGLYNGAQAVLLLHHGNGRIDAIVQAGARTISLITYNAATRRFLAESAHAALLRCI